ncbi:MAG: tRNA preQ1(34) S-adenosylmethionine ribosyltransferase-isomerase QueA [Deltaproteobacteria bacterium]
MINIHDLDSYRFEVPEELIAQYPIEPRDSSRLLVLSREDGDITDTSFNNIVNYLRAGDTLVLNDTRVIPARLFGRKPSGARVEILLLRKTQDSWEALVRPARRLRPGDRVILDVPGSKNEDDDRIELEIQAEMDMSGGRQVRFCNCNDEMNCIEALGHMPLPPYIKRLAENEDNRRYQTVYANQTGSAAAPTAGLHFTRNLLSDIDARGINIVKVLLHVGLGTFRPVSTSDIRQHQMHYEYCQISREAAVVLNHTRQQGGRIVAVGTTVVRTLESFYSEQGFGYGEMQTNRFIYPGYQFKGIDAMITNFHLPGSSLIMLVSAFAGYENTMSAYRHAIEDRYRFFSFGDAMLII